MTSRERALVPRRPSSFVGRVRELTAFAEFLGEPGTASGVMSIVAPGGTGKSTLLRVFHVLTAERGRTVVRLDALDLPTLRPAFRAAFREACGDAEVVLVDSFEALRGLEALVAESILDQPSGARRWFVLAGRLSPSAELRTVVEHGVTLRSLALADLSPEEADEYLAGRGVDARERPEMVRHSHGHALALALTADAHLASGAPITLGRHPDLLSELVSVFLRDIPDPVYQEAIRIAALARTTTEEPLAALLGGQSDRAFHWLRGLSFMQSRSHGLTPHPLARDVLVADLRWRNMAAFQSTLHRLFEFYSQRVAAGHAAHTEFVQLSYLLRHSPVLRPFFDIPLGLDAALDVAQPGDAAALVRLCERHRGPESAALCAAWFVEQPSSFYVVRGTDGAVRGFGAHLRLDGASHALRARDPATARGWDFARRLEQRALPVTYVRWLIMADEYPPLSPEMALCWTIAGFAALQLPALAFTFQPIESRVHWPLIATSGARHHPDLAFDLDGHHHEVSVLDRRSATPVEWATTLVRRALDLDAGGAIGDVPLQQPSPSVLDAAQFAESVRVALRSLHDRRRLRKSPLLETRLLAGCASEPASVDRLRSLLVQEVEALRGTSRGDRTYLAAQAVYLDGTQSQQGAAERLGMADSTLRRHLHEAIDRVQAALWERELRVRGSP